MDCGNAAAWRQTNGVNWRGALQLVLLYEAVSLGDLNVMCDFFLGGGELPWSTMTMPSLLH